MFGVFAISLLNKDFYIYERLVCTWDKKIKPKITNKKNLGHILGQMLEEDICSFRNLSIILLFNQDPFCKCIREWADLCRLCNKVFRV